MDFCNLSALFLAKTAKCRSFLAYALAGTQCPKWLFLIALTAPSGSS